MNQTILDWNNLIDINRLIIALFLNVPGWKFVLYNSLCSRVPFDSPALQTRIYIQCGTSNPDDVIINKPMIEPVIPNYVGSTRKVVANSMCDLLCSQILTVAFVYQISVKLFHFFHGDGQEGEVQLDCQHVPSLT